MKRAKNKKAPIKRPTKTPFEIVKTTNYLHFAILIRVLWTVYGYRSKRIANFLEAYVALFAEIADKRNTVTQTIKETKEITGVDVVKLVDSLTER